MILGVLLVLAFALLVMTVALVATVVTLLLLPFLLVGTGVGAWRVWTGRRRGWPWLLGCAGFLCLWSATAWLVS